MRTSFINSRVIIIAILAVGTLLLQNSTSTKPGDEINIGTGDTTDLTDTYLGSQYEELIFVEDGKENVVIALTSEGKVVKKIPVGLAPHDIAASPDGSMVATANQDGGSVSIVDTRQLKLLRNISTGAGAHGLVFSPDGKYLYVANVEASTLSVVDTTLWEEIQEIHIDSNPEYVGITLDGKQVFTTNLGGDSVTVLSNREDGLSVQKSLQLGIDPHGWAMTPDGSKVVITNFGRNYTLLLDTQDFEEISRIHTGETTEFATFKDNSELWVTNIGSHYISLINIDQNRILDQIEVGETPHGISFSQDKTLAFVPLFGPGEVVIIDVVERKVITKVKVGDELHNAVVVSLN